MASTGVYWIKSNKENRFIDYFEAALCYTNENRVEPDGLGKLCLTKRDDKDKMNVLPTTVKKKKKNKISKEKEFGETECVIRKSNLISSRNNFPRESILY